MSDAEAVWRDVERIRAEAPLVHNITNYVAMNSTANALLALGASPVMAHAVEEIGEMVGIARALVVNIGTLSAPWIESMRRAVGAAQGRGLPWVLDPVGAGATRLRTDTAVALLSEAAPAVIRGNGSEIRALFGTRGGTKGVDSTHASADAVEAAAGLARRWNCVVVASGAVDYIVDKDAVVRVANGHALMPKVTGLGCTASALVGAFAAVNPAPRAAAAHAMAVMGIAGEMAAERSPGPGSMQVHFLDALYRMSEADIRQRLRME